MKSIVLFAIASIVLGIALPQAKAADTYNVDGVHSYALFKIKHLAVGYSYGRFNEVSGTLSLDTARPEKSSVELTVKAASVDTANPKRDQHLKSPDFFNAKQFPEITFKSTSVKLTGKDTAAVTGELTLHGVTRTIVAEVAHTGSGKDPWGGVRAGFEATFSVKRSDFGMTFMQDGLSDEVQVIVSVEGVKG